jgi:hypothetical protein
MAGIGKPSEVQQYQETLKNASRELGEARLWSKNELTKSGGWKD